MKYNRAWLPLNGLRAFESTARNRSFTKAAEELCVTQSAVSRQVQRLEILLGVKLFERKNREIILTAYGQRLFKTTSDGFDLLLRTLREVAEEDQQEILRLSITVSFAHCFGPMFVRAFTNAHPSVRLEIDSKWEAFELEASEYDLCITYSEPKITEHVMDLLWDEEVTPICAPSLVLPTDGKNPEAFLRRNTLLHIKTNAGLYYTWETWAKHHNIAPSAVRRGMAFNTSILGVRCAMEGEGVVVADRRLYTKEIESGSLVTPFSACRSGFGYYLIFRRDDLNNERLQQFRSWIIEQFKEQSP